MILGPGQSSTGNRQKAQTQHEWKMPCLYTLYLTVSTHGKFHEVYRLSRQVKVHAGKTQKAPSRHAVTIRTFTHVALGAVVGFLVSSLL